MQLAKISEKRKVFHFNRMRNFASKACSLTFGVLSFIRQHKGNGVQHVWAVVLKEIERICV